MGKEIEIGKRIKARREELNMTQEELGNRLWLNKSTIQRYETGKIAKIKLPVLHAMARQLNVDPNWLALKTDNMGVFSEQKSWYEAGNFNTDVDKLVNSIPPVRIPIYSYIPAGIPMEAIEEIVDYEEVPASWIKGDKEFFGMKIKGDSMSPEYRDGDTVIFKKQSTCENGDDCAVMVNGNDATFKRVRRELGGIILQPLNPAYDPMSFSNEEIVSKPVRIIGVFWELRRSRH